MCRRPSPKSMRSYDLADPALRARFPGLCIVGTAAPQIEDLTDHPEIVNRIREVQPDPLFVAFGAPKQDRWIEVHKNYPLCYAA